MNHNWDSASILTGIKLRLKFRQLLLFVHGCLNLQSLMVIVAQLVRAPDCGSGGRGFESRLSPQNTYLVKQKRPSLQTAFFYFNS
jgi:hypothetical protein